MNDKSIYRADEYTYGGYDNTELLMRLHSDGSVTWVLPLHVTTTCDVTIRRFPYDSQECAIQFVFFGLNGVDVNANLAPEVFHFIVFFKAMNIFPNRRDNYIKIGDCIAKFY